MNDRWTSGVIGGCLEPSPDGRTFVVSAYDFNEESSYRTFRMIHLSEKSIVRWARPSGPEKVVFTPDGRWLVGGKTMPGLEKEDPQRLVIHSADDGQQYLVSLPAHCVPQTATALTPDGETLISCGNDGKILLWDWHLVVAQLPKK